VDKLFHALIGRNPSFWRINLLAWFGFGLFSIVARLMVFPVLWEAVVFSLLQVPLGVGLSALMRLVYKRPGIADPFRVSTAAWVIILSLAAGLIDAWLYQTGVDFTGWRGRDLGRDVEFDLRIKLFWIVYMGWSVGYFAVRAKMEAAADAKLARAAGEEARRMELQLLRAQLDPHFLFNALNSIASEIGPHPESARAMVVELAAYLRYSLDHRNQTLGSLADELDAVDAYLSIQRARFGDRFDAYINAGTRARNTTVPNFLLQPLVENAVKHGMETNRPQWELNIRAHVTGNVLTVEVRNAGCLIPPDSGRVGVGLETLRRRLELHYPDRHRFELVEEGGFVCARLILNGAPCSA
jgi:two-component system, LytTR family, sensor kinase